MKLQAEQAVLRSRLVQLGLRLSDRERESRVALQHLAVLNTGDAG